VTTDGSSEGAPLRVDLPSELQAAARSVSNWGKWGPDDELGTLNYITPDMVARAAATVRDGVTFSLSVPFDDQGPQAAHGIRRNPIHLMSIDGGDSHLMDSMGGWSGPMRFNDDYIMMPLQCATQWDALSHAYYDKKLYNGFDSSTVTSFGATRDSIDKVAAAGRIVGRGVLLDVARHRGVRQLEARTIVGPDELDAVAEAQQVVVGEGDIVIVRTGWWLEFLAHHNGEEWGMTSPGLSWRCAQWLSERRAAAVACDNLAVESMTMEVEGVMLPLHMLTLRDMGMMLGEMWNLEDLGSACAADGRYEFLLVAAPLLVTGAVGSPINPVAVK
jgi:kynurenine formamidase